jgi:hypothetical protein
MTNPVQSCISTDTNPCQYISHYYYIGGGNVYIYIKKN